MRFVHWFNCRLTFIQSHVICWVERRKELASTIAALLKKIYEYSDRRVYGNWNG